MMNSIRNEVLDLVNQYFDDYKNASEEVMIGSFIRVTKELQGNNVKPSAALEMAILCYIGNIKNENN